jgi:hypothetical protein
MLVRHSERSARSSWGVDVRSLDSGSDSGLDGGEEMITISAILHEWVSCGEKDVSLEQRVEDFEDIELKGASKGDAKIRVRSASLLESPDLPRPPFHLAKGSPGDFARLLKDDAYFEYVADCSSIHRFGLRTRLL